MQKEECLDMLANPNSPSEYAVYCPIENLCGLGLTPNNTGELNILYDKNCSTFATEVALCTKLDQQLLASGKCFGDSFYVSRMKANDQNGWLVH